MIRLDCAAATRASTERAVPGPGGRRASSNALLDISVARFDSRVSELALPVPESETGRHPEADRHSEASGTARSISWCGWASIETALSAADREDASDFRVNAARLKACNATETPQFACRLQSRSRSAYRMISR